jgi:hypothetical protein
MYFPVLCSETGAELRWGRPGPWPAQNLDNPSLYLLGRPNKGFVSEKIRASVQPGPPTILATAPPLRTRKLAGAFSLASLVNR